MSFKLAPASGPVFDQRGFRFTAPLLVSFVAGLMYIIGSLHYALPAPQHASSINGTAVFSEAIAQKYVSDMSVREDGSPIYRIVGTIEMPETEEYIKQQVVRIKQEMLEKLGQFHEIELFHQVGDGDHLFDFMGKPVWKRYYSITNVIVRLSAGTPESKENAILVNAHTDSTLPTPGAADDLIGVAVMLEALRVMALTPTKLKNSVVFLFNGAEESLQDASHLFITQHPLRNTIRSVINIEACGVDGAELVFQATSREMIKAISKSPRPIGTVVGTEIFSSGLILSDTDFRQFVQYGNLTGIDMALVQNSYAYHTRLDTADYIEPGAYQHMGENVLAMLRYLTSNETTLGVEPFVADHPSETVYFSLLAGRIFFIFTRAEATLIYGILTALAAIVLSNRIDSSERRLYFYSFLGVFGSLFGAIIGANIAAFVLVKVFERPMTWFRNEQYPILVFGPPAVAGALAAQSFAASKLRPHFGAHTSQIAPALEHSTLIGTLGVFLAITLLMHSVRIGSACVFGLSAVSALLSVLINEYVLMTQRRGVHIITYFILQIVPTLFQGELVLSVLDIFVPLTGRTGADAPSDFIIATITALGVFLCVPSISPYIHRHGARIIARAIPFCVIISTIILVQFGNSSWQIFDKYHPQRMLVLHMENISTTPSTFDFHIAALDNSPIYEKVANFTHSFTEDGVVPELQTNEDGFGSEWDIIFPVDQFLTAYKVPLPSADSSYVSPWENFKVTAKDNRVNPIKRQRTLTIHMQHDNIIWPVIAFNADIVSWDLSESPERGQRRHHVKSVAAYGVTEFSVTLTIQLTEAEYRAHLLSEQRRKNQRHSSPDDQASIELGGLKIDFSGLDVNGMYPASSRHYTQGSSTKPGMNLFKKFDANLPDSVDSMLVSAIAGSTII